MGKRREAVLRQRIFEARYEQGYRYLDRCGDTMVILEDLLTSETEHIWLPGDMAPTSARIECPDLDLTVVFDSYHLVVDQIPVGDIQFDFVALAETTLAMIVGRFDLRRMQRFGYRRVKIIPADSVEDADKLSLRMSPVKDWRSEKHWAMRPSSAEFVSEFEVPDRSQGIRLVAKPFNKVGASVKVDERLRRPAHHLPTEQHEALVAQLRRKREQERDPEAGVLIDIDYYWVRPPADYNIKQFLDTGLEEADRLEADFLKGQGAR